MRKSNKIALGLGIVFLLAACTTTKSRKDTSALGELYHNTTAHYNGYFNANELVLFSTLTLEEQHEDNYTQLLPMYPFIISENAQSVTPDMDLAVEKVAKVVSLHPQSKWSDDCYLLAGKAQFIKQDYESAEETFRYLVNEYTPDQLDDKKAAGNAPRTKQQKEKERAKVKAEKEKVAKAKRNEAKKAKKAREKYNKQVRKKRKKGKTVPKPSILEKATEEEKVEEVAEEKAEEAPEKEDKDDTGEDGFLKHRPAYQEGLLWLSKTLIERDNYDAAQRYMNQLQRQPGIYKDVKAELAAVQAYYYIHQKKYGNAIPALDEAITLEKDKKRRARLSYIQAQLFQMQGNTAAAFAAYQRTLKSSPSYEMAFNCKMNMALNSASNTEARANLEKLLKDEKNELFKDQIYFALAQLDLQAGDKANAIVNLRQSLKYSRQNRAQKAESYLTLADLYYEAEEYVNAKNYYDSTLQVLAGSDERHLKITRLSQNLKDIAVNIETIELQDSLLAISALSEDEQKALALEIRQKEEAARLKQIADAAAAQNKVGAAGPRSAALPGPALKKESNFFAYDDRAVKRGVKEFARRWDNRPLEDNWRRSNKSASNYFDDEVTEPKPNTDFLTEDDLSKYLKDVPKTDAQIATARIKLQEAMLKLGSLYRERLENYPKAIAVLTELDNRFPGNNYEMDAWYQLYLSHLALNQSSQAQVYADKIISQYPNSKYALVIQNPNYGDELAKEERQLNDYYDAAYASFTSGNYRDAYDKSVSARQVFGAANVYQPKFALLAAMSSGNLEGKEAYVNALKEVIAKYPNTDEQRRAREILRLLGENTASLPGGAAEESQQFVMNESQVHYMLILFEDPNVDLNAAKIDVSDYNEKYHKNQRLRISNIFLGDDPKSRLPLLVLRRYKDQAEAMDYYQEIAKNAEQYIDDSMRYEVFPVTQDNYRQVLKEKSLTNYKLWFEANYK
ncbi:MAG TPA: tetratricopeptide repeat protein [Saprospiraceae bacterium]|nr:tetratricopeptide repeat protein [Saprospiraceae bacterium]HMQ84698.1 tetratricopeptide repeat protein [Saprospiraceae bacterium]